MLLASWVVGKKDVGQTLAALVRQQLNLSWAQAKRIVQNRQVRVNSVVCVDPALRLHLGKRIEIHGSSPIDPKGASTPPKRSGLSPTTPSQRGQRRGVSSPKIFPKPDAAPLNRPQPPSKPQLPSQPKAAEPIGEALVVNKTPGVNETPSVNETSGVNETPRLSETRRVGETFRGGKTGRVVETSQSEPPPMPRSALVYVDDSILVVEKPAGLTTMRHPDEADEFGPRGKRYLPPTLLDRLPSLLPGATSKRIRAVHRLDRDTSGLLVFARHRQAEEYLTEQFRKHTVDRRYLAAVRGTPSSGRIESYLVRDRGDGRRGSGDPAQGRKAVTWVRLLESIGRFSLVECRLETGRTHQVRIHLGEAGTPLCGETIYDRPMHGAPWPDGSQAPRIALHATHLAFRHPETHEWMRFDSPWPQDLAPWWEGLRRAVLAEQDHAGGESMQEITPTDRS